MLKRILSILNRPLPVWTLIPVFVIMTTISVFAVVPQYTGQLTALGTPGVLIKQVSGNNAALQVEGTSGPPVTFQVNGGGQVLSAANIESTLSPMLNCLYGQTTPIACISSPVTWVSEAPNNITVTASCSVNIICTGTLVDNFPAGMFTIDPKCYADDQTSGVPVILVPSAIALTSVTWSVYNSTGGTISSSTSYAVGASCVGF